MLVSLSPSSHRKESTNAKYHQTLILELENLITKGLEVKVDGKLQTVYFQLCLPLRDNLGLNQLIGFKILLSL